MNYFYKKGLDICNSKQCFEFIKNHFNYYTMNSWNGLRSIANNVKVYNLHLDGNCWNALALLEEERYFTVNEMLYDFERDHPGYEVSFNGRSGGYLILGNKDNNKSIIPDDLDFENYEDFKENCKEYYGGVKHYTDLRFYTELIRDFDKLCDKIRAYVNMLSKFDPIEKIAQERLDRFNETYYEELKEFNIEDFELSKDKTINVSEKAMKHTSLIDQLFNFLKSDVYKTILDGNTIKLVTE